MKSFTALFAFCISTASVANTYYASNTGNDVNDGLTVAFAFETLQHASDIVQAGDSVIVLAGTYVGFYLETSGTADDRIVFLAEDGVIINQPNETTDDGINLEGASYVNIDGFYVDGVPRAGIRSVINEGIIIRNNYCTGCSYWGILTGFSENIIIENNTCEYSVEEHGIYFGNSADNPIIRNNTCRYNNANGIHMNADASLGGDGIISNALVEANIIYENGVAGGSGINCDGVQDSYIANNLIYDNHASGISLYMIDAAEPCHGTVVVNNTIMQPDDARWALNLTNGSSGVVVFNNILLSDHAFRGSITADPTVLETLACDYNICADRFSVDDGDTNISLAEWQEQTGNDANSVVAFGDQFFLNTNYEIFYPSPACDHGIDSFNDISAPLFDLIGELRPIGNGYDLGCYESYDLAIRELGKKPEMTWNELPMNSTVCLYDVCGKLIGFNTKEYFLLNQHKLVKQVFLFKASMKNGELVSGKFLND